MVEIREESTEPFEANGPSTPGNTSTENTRASTGIMTLSEFVKSRTMDCVLFSTRVFTVVFALCYLLPIVSPTAQNSSYYKALAAAAATNALRMQQRVGSITLSREFFARLLLEDSCHYLFFAILFLTSAPVTMALLPVVLFAALHASNFIVTAMNAIGAGANSLVGKLHSFTQSQTQNCLGIIACSEIFIAPLLVSMIFMGRASMFVPFVYYRFLSLRYSSRRNPYTRQAFYQMRCSLEQITGNSSCPGLVRVFIHKSVAFISNLAPPV